MGMDEKARLDAFEKMLHAIPGKLSEYGPENETSERRGKRKNCDLPPAYGK